MSFEFTEGQRQAIESRGSAVLVSAAAGSGKTRVLTQRLLARVSDPADPVDIDRFLVITYTRAAAAELRTRIMDALALQAADAPADTRLRRQQSLCCRASIGTIHSFCTAILREYSQLLGISPAFTVLDEDRAAQLQSTVLSRLLDQHYEQIETDTAFRLLSNTVGAGRNDDQLQAALLKLYEKLRSHPYPEDWAAQQKAALQAEGVTDIGKTPWGEALLAQAAASADYWIAALEASIAEMRNADDGEKIWNAYGTRFASAAEQLRDLRRAIDGGWDRARQFSAIRFEALGRLVKYPDAGLKDRMSAVWNGTKKACAALAEVFSQDSETQLRDLRATVPAMSALLDLTLELDRACTAEKNRRGVLDFSDLEHYAARLLVDKATGAPTWVARELSQRYTEVMVDEYQDVNAIQELIFRAVSRDEKNLFLVGDVKQSIYRFRLADPSLFLAKYRDYAPAETAAPGEPRRILLQENFRSRAPILQAANLVMGNIMSEALGELDYDENAALKYGAKDYDRGLDAPAELHIIDAKAVPQGGDDDAPPEAAAAEARFIADKILSLMRSGAPVTEGGGTRPCRWGDFVLLMRSRTRGGVFRRVLESRGIPVESTQGGGFYSSLEVSAVIDLLAVIDNPHNDVPLISVLRSPIFGFSADELSSIRVADRDGDFYTALLTAAENGNSRCIEFLRALEGWRGLAPELSPDALIWRLCSDTGLFAICAAMGDGAVRRQRLMQLFELGRSFGAGGYQGLFRFVQWLRRKAEKNDEPAAPAPGQAVRIMSVHSSKGLEFPFVFLCDLAHKFNKQDFRDRVLFHSELGLGPKVIDAERGLCYPTAAFRAVRDKLNNELLSEEMRVLYVAMTRAKERLFLTCAWNKPSETLAKLVPVLRSPLPPEILSAESNFSKWITMAALPAPDVLPVTVHGEAEPDGEAELPTPPPADGEAAAAALDALRTRLEFRYPRAGVVDLPSKLTATELKRAQAEEDEAFPAVSPPEEPALSFRRAEPGTAHRKLSAARRGTAAHAFLQYVDFAKADSLAGLQSEAARLTASGLLKPEESETLDFAALHRFFASPTGQRLRAAEQVRREFRFLLLAKAEDYFPAAAGSGDELLLQGVVDCCFAEDGGITVLDYKTDRVTAAQVPARAEHYRGQLETYAKALERIFGLPVKHSILWFLHPGAEYEVALKNP